MLLPDAVVVPRLEVSFAVSQRTDWLRFSSSEESLYFTFIFEARLPRAWRSRWTSFPLRTKTSDLHRF